MCYKISTTDVVANLLKAVSRTQRPLGLVAGIIWLAGDYAVLFVWPAECFCKRPFSMTLPPAKVTFSDRASAEDLTAKYFTLHRMKHAMKLPVFRGHGELVRGSAPVNTLLRQRYTGETIRGSRLCFLRCCDDGQQKVFASSLMSFK